MTRRLAFLSALPAVGFALASGCDSRLLVGENPDAGGTAGASGTAGSSHGGSAGTMASGGTAGAGTGGTFVSTGTAGTGDAPMPPTSDAGIPLDAWIAFDSNGGGVNRDIYIIRADGSGRRRLTTEASSDTQPSFSRDGTKLAFVSDRSGGGAQIYLMDLATGAATRVTQRADGAHDPAFTYDGTRIGYRSGDSVYTSKLDGTGEQVMTNGATCCTGGPFGAPVFPSNGQTIYDDYNAIYMTGSPTTTRRTIVMPTTGEQSHPSLSSDESNLTLQATCAGDNAARSIWIVPAMQTTAYSCTGGARLSPTGVDATHASWGPNNMIVWGSITGGTNSNSPVPSDLVTWQNGVLHTLTSGSGDDRNPSWSSPGTVIGTW